mmetsp:Transcript_33146/g.40678  ORF Transcript_33146/g.40678 Transcript_33146/m.40678 type:complete len:399 (-) Transcript_33146:80-1276(-)|eukprot:CAMPEP_0204832710 /NCGR_PEP_ID=MMETSP1346-20131115/14477_1 /ASSEMBLY_ACC=CAM_ASM_000771 /TAXON_ID=215587 /ORGANISM="Aplanochytrium stocchinoi, Strain GSBS06" /LENGTH=398 /DNA_ID=CAMNT_0051964691 /DNA_START=105 /DNA_END=1301 /DNA_ORIENTATION=-
MSVLITSVVEVVIVLLFGMFMSKHPKTSVLLSIILALAVQYVLFGLWAIGPFEKTMGSQVVGREFMRAAVFAPETTQGLKLDAEVPIPNHNSKQALIHVKAAALNPSNYKVTLASIPFIRHIGKHVVGYDFAGSVVSVGSDPSCRKFKVGEYVYGMAATGSIAEYARAQCSMIAHKPKSLDFKQAASLPVVALTSLEAYMKTGLKKGDNVLVIGASGGCGIYGITLAEKVFKAKATGICSTKNVDFVKSIGASAVVDYKSESAMKELSKKGRQFDVIYDTVSSFDPVDPDYEPSMAQLLRENGKYIAINGWFSDWTRCLLSKITVPLFAFDVNRPNYELFLLDATTEMLETLASYFDSKTLTKTPIATVINLDRNESLWSGFEQMQSRRTVGKIVFEI